jgi:hypothetical protein
VLTANEPNIPEWVPDYIAAKARELRQAHADSAIAVDLIERLMTDVRMGRVWAELGKRNRRTKGPRHNVAARFASRGTDERSAAAGLLEFAFNLGRLTLMLPSTDNPARPYKARAQKYRDEAEQLVHDRGAQGIRQLLLLLARYCDLITYSAHNPSEAVAVEIAHWLETVFGSPMYKTTATITSVIVGQGISERKVRTWFLAESRTLPKSK